MGLDAYVFCDCYEKGQLYQNPPAGISLQVEADGFLDGNLDGLSVEEQVAFDVWKEEKACSHRGGVLLHHRLGNIALVALLRSELRQQASRFPILLQKVLYSGIHAGDHLPVEVFANLEQELALLSQLRARRSRLTKVLQRQWPRFGTLGYYRLPSARTDVFVQHFRIQMQQLLSAARRIGKPIAF